MRKTDIGVRIEWHDDESEFWEALFLCGFRYRLFIRLTPWRPR